MQLYDIGMLCVLGLATLYGAWKGMAWQVASLASLVISYFVALRFSASLAPHLSEREPWNRFCAMLVLYLGTSLVIWLAFRVVSRAIDRVELKQFDTQVGALMGATKGVLLCVAITFFAVSLANQSREMVLRSSSGYYIAVFIDRADPIMPEEIRDVLHPYLVKLGNELKSGQAARSASSASGMATSAKGRTGASAEGRAGVSARRPAESDDSRTR